jgi:hypothetical protein
MKFIRRERVNRFAGSTSSSVTCAVNDDPSFVRDGAGELDEKLLVLIVVVFLGHQDLSEW